MYKYHTHNHQSCCFCKSGMSWHKYVRAPQQSIVLAHSIVSELTTGRVTDPEALLKKGGEATVLQRDEGEPAPRIVIDFGQNIVGWLSIEFAAGSVQDTGLRLAFSESLQYLTEVCDFTRSDNGETITPGTDQISVSSHQHTWKNVRGSQFNNGHVNRDGLHGFRYLAISLDALETDAAFAKPHGRVEIDSLSLEYSAYRGTPDTFTGTFECSDPELTQWWYDGVYTNDITVDTFRADDAEPREAVSDTLIGKQVLHDGAKRDRDPYVGDLGVAARTAYLSHSELEEAVVNVLADLGDHQRADGWVPPASIKNYNLPLFDYPLWWVICSYDHLMYTGKQDYVRKYYDKIKRVMNEYYPSKMKSGLVVKDETTDSAGYGDYAFLPRTGIVTYYNVLYVLALQYGCVIADALGDQDQREQWQRRSREVSRAINDKLWDSESGAYIDHSIGGKKYHAQDGNSLAVIASVADHTRSEALLAYLNSNALPYGNPFYDHDLEPGFSQRVYAFISYFEIQARFLQQQAPSAIDQIKRTFGWMIQQGPGTFWEGIGPNGSLYEDGFTSLAHGWSTGIVPALTEFVLGIRPVEPGYKTWSVKPVIGGTSMTWARGKVRTAYGDIVVSWSRTVDWAFSMDIEAPPDTKGFVYVPKTHANDVTTEYTLYEVNGSPSYKWLTPH